jgi:hypothetical protein
MVRPTSPETRRRLLCRWLGLVLVVACGGESEEAVTRSENDVAPESSLAAVVPLDPPRAARQNSPLEPESDEGSTFLEQGCEQSTERISEMDCDPFLPDEGCPFGQACKPFVEYPESPCEPERFGARCDWVGDAVQGDPCNFDLCASGYLCIATGQGTQCAQICRISGPSGCPAGLVCGSLDIEGIGTCF